MLKIVLIVAVLAILGVLALAATRPNTLKVQRAIAIKAPPGRIYALIDDFHRWSAWSPYERKDPGMKRSFAGAASGQGAVYAWDGNNNVGSGRMEIVRADQPSKVVIKLDFSRPMEGHNIATFTLEPDGEATRVTWAMEGPTPFMGKLMGLVFNMDRMIGGDFDTGLANLKAAAEA